MPKRCRRSERRLADLGGDLAVAFVESGETVARELKAFIDQTAADEIMVAAAIYQHQARLRSYVILAANSGSLHAPNGDLK
jgi:alkanesulfonate monooxygenase SsuD/methylene tetrahydromethanopterin reductase-like flavin-dependent oxidoreductase (luciferase family)